MNLWSTVQPMVNLEPSKPQEAHNIGNSLKISTTLNGGAINPILYHMITFDNGNRT